MQLVVLNPPMQAAFDGIVKQWYIKTASGGSSAQASGQGASAGITKTPRKTKRQTDDEPITPSKRNKRSRKDNDDDDDQDPSAFRPQSKQIGFTKYERFAGTPCIGVYAGFKYPFYNHNPGCAALLNPIPKVMNAGIAFWWPKQKKIDSIAKYGIPIADTLEYVNNNGPSLTKMKQEMAREILGLPTTGSSASDKYANFWFFKNEQIKSPGATKDNNWSVNPNFDRAMRNYILANKILVRFYHVWIRGVSGGVASLSSDDGTLIVYMALLAVGTELAKRWREHLGDEQGFMQWMNEAFVRSKASAVSTATTTKLPNLYHGLITRLDEASRTTCELDCKQIEENTEFKDIYELIVLFGETYKNGTLHTASYWNPRKCRENNLSMDEGIQVRADIEERRLANLNDVEVNGAEKLTYDQLEEAALANFLAKTDMSTRGQNYSIYTDADKELMKTMSPVDITDFKNKPLATNMASGSKSRFGGVSLEEIKSEISKAHMMQTPLLVDAVIHKLEQKIYPYLNGLLADTVRNTVGTLRIGFPSPGRFIVGSMEMGDNGLRLQFAHVADHAPDDPVMFLRHLILGYIPVEKTRHSGHPGNPRDSGNAPGHPEPKGSNPEAAGSNPEAAGSKPAESAGSSSQNPVVISSSAGTERSPNAELVLVLLTCSWRIYAETHDFLLSECATVVYSGCSNADATTWLSESAVSSVVPTVIKLHRLLLPAELADMIVDACRGPNYSVNLSSTQHARLRSYLLDAYRDLPATTIPMTEEQNALYSELWEDLLRYRRLVRERLDEAQKKKRIAAVMKQELESGKKFNSETGEFEEPASESDRHMTDSDDYEDDEPEELKPEELELKPVDAAAKDKDATPDDDKKLQLQIAELEHQQKLLEEQAQDTEKKKAEEQRKLDKEAAELAERRAQAKKDFEAADAQAKELRERREASSKASPATPLEEARRKIQEQILKLQQQKQTPPAKETTEKETSEKGKEIASFKGKDKES